MNENTEERHGDSEKAEVLEQTEQVEQARPEPEFRLTVATDKMAAYLSVVNRRDVGTISPAQILSFLAENGIVYGIKETEVEDYCAHQKFFLELLCAEGDPAEPEEDGEIVYYFRRDVKACPKEREDGTVDFRNLGMMQEIKADTVLCTLKLPEGGKDGTDIFGRPVKRRPGRVPRLPQGNNTYPSADGFSLLAKVDGCICYKNELVSIDDIYVIKGDVDHSVGNIMFSGSVLVHGDVRSGFKIVSGGDIQVRGVVEAAEIEAKGNITISLGMVGMGRGVFKAGGTVTAKYFENTTGYCEQNVFADFYVNSHITAGGSIVARGSRAAVLGGSYQAKKAIYVGTVGSDANIATLLEIMDARLIEAVSGARNPAVKQLSKRLEELMHTYDEFEKKRKFYQSGENIDFAMLKKLLLRKSHLERQIKECEDKLREMDKKDVFNDYKIAVKHIAYPGTKIVMGPFVYNLMQKEHHTKYVLDGHDIQRADVLPSDTIERNG